MNKKLFCWLLLSAVMLFCVAGAREWQQPHDETLWKEKPLDKLVLLIPDALPVTDARVTVWLDAAREEGLHLQPERAKAFRSRFATKQMPAGVILPDKVHVAMNDNLVHALRRYVNEGGRLFQTFDAGTLTATQFYAPGKSRLSDLAGVNYALYEQLRGGSITLGPIYATQPALDELGIQPGKFVSSPVRGTGGSQLLTLAGYQRPYLSYPGFVTRGNYQGRTLLQGSQGLAAGLQDFGKGKVLFVNMPLGYLAGRTDSLMLHTFLRYFGESVLQLPRLSPVPDGVGGLVMNWHVDSNADNEYVLHNMKDLGIYNQGPYSIHITAGPDTREHGDRMGVNVPGDRAIQDWIREVAANGHAIGSHGGWIHDYFGVNLPETPSPEFEKYLQLNKTTLEMVLGQPLLEYSAPQGNQPRWVSRWLADRGVIGFYFTGNTGVGPTRNYRDGAPEVSPQKLWAFPVSNLGTAGSFEELDHDKVDTAIVERWLRDMTRFSAARNTCRLIYFHPNGTHLYPEAMRGWLQQAKMEADNGRFHWYTMTAMASFQNRREDVRWMVTSRRKGERIFAARHPQNLNQQAWFLPMSKYGQPQVVQGRATVSRSGDSWLVVAGEGTTLQFNAGVS